MREADDSYGAERTINVVDEHRFDRLGKLEEIERRCRLAYLAGAEEYSLRSQARHLTQAEQQRVLKRYRGDWPGAGRDALIDS